MQHQEFVPPEELRDLVKCFWYNRRAIEESQSGFQVQPDGHAEIIFYFGGTLSISSNGGLQPLPSPFMVGLLEEPAIFYADTCLEIIGIRCFPWTVLDLLELPAATGVVRTFVHPISDLQFPLDKLIRAGKIPEALEQVNHFSLHKQLQIKSDSMVFKAGAAMRKTKGNISVTAVAAAAHASVRTLERNFKKSSGYAVKDVSSLMRFEQARNRLWQYPNTKLAALAYELGYTDQSHLCREFKRYSGSTPSAFAKKAKKQVQVIKDNFVVFIQI